MNLRQFDEDLISAIQGLPKYDTSQFSKLEALRLLEVREQMLFGIFADFTGRIGDEVRAEAPCFIGSCRITPQALDFFQQNVIDEAVEAIEAEEKNAAEPYFSEVAE